MHGMYIFCNNNLSKCKCRSDTILIIPMHFVFSSKSCGNCKTKVFEVKPSESPSKTSSPSNTPIAFPSLIPTSSSQPSRVICTDNPDFSLNMSKKTCDWVRCLWSKCFQLWLKFSSQCLTIYISTDCSSTSKEAPEILCKKYCNRELPLDLSKLLRWWYKFHLQK